MAFEFLPFLSAAFGWTYFTAWSISFYPQATLNFKRRSTSGTTIDFPLINTLGFLSYFIYTAALLWSPLIRHQYAARNHGLTPTVQLNDVAFAFHGFVMCVVTTSQYWPGVWGFPPDAAQRPSRVILGIGAGCMAGVAVIVVLVLASANHDGLQPAMGWASLDVMYAVSYVKLLVTVAKYAPQLLANFRNRSTSGWSIYTILLDFGGSILSLAQLGIDSYLQHDWSGITGNMAKFLLGNVGIGYDICFIAQHYLLYRGKQEKHGDREPLLENGS